MDTRRDIKLDLKRTVENAVSGNDEFHFFVDELSQNGCMPTYAGLADEKYSFDEMDDDFFDFLKRKSGQNGIYIRLIHATSSMRNGTAVFELEYAGSTRTVEVEDASNVVVFEFADFGIRVRGDEITFGATVDGGCAHTPYFAEFGSLRGNAEFLSLENPINRLAVEIMEEMIFAEE